MTLQSVLKSFWCCWMAAEVSCFQFIYLTNHLEINICHGLRAVIQSLKFRNQSWDQQMQMCHQGHEYKQEKRLEFEKATREYTVVYLRETKRETSRKATFTASRSTVSSPVGLNGKM